MSGIDDPWSKMKMGMLTRVMTTCARVILMALTGDGSMSTNCCTELKVWYTHTYTQQGSRAPTHPRAAVQAHRHTNTRRGLMEKEV